MKKIDAKNQLWYIENGSLVQVGLTRSFLDILDECWHIFPANTTSITAKAPLLTVETNDGLVSLASPVTGHVVNWDMKAANFPDKLTEDDIILTLSTDKKTKQVEPINPMSWMEFAVPAATARRAVYANAATPVRLQDADL